MGIQGLDFRGEGSEFRFRVSNLCCRAGRQFLPRRCAEFHLVPVPDKGVSRE